MEIERKVESELLAWKQRRNRQPLLLIGAHQVGKSFTAAHFGRTNFTSVIQLDFQTDLARLRPIFEPGFRVIGGFWSNIGLRLGLSVKFRIDKKSISMETRFLVIHVAVT